MLSFASRAKRLTRFWNRQNQVNSNVMNYWSELKFDSEATILTTSQLGRFCTDTHRLINSSNQSLQKHTNQNTSWNMHHIKALEKIWFASDVSQLCKILNFPMQVNFYDNNFPLSSYSSLYEWLSNYISLKK